MAHCCTRRAFGLAAALLLLASLGAQAAAPKFNFVDPRTIDLSRLVAPPPTDTSEATRAELEAMLLIQERRSPAQAAQALVDNDAGVEAFSEALGSPTSLKGLKLPLLVALVDKVGEDTSRLVGAGKKAFERPRPYAVEKRLKPVLPLSPDSSYPSGTAAWGYVTGTLLADMVPERRAAILARAEGFGRNRVIGGVHYPSDVEAARMTAAIFTAFLFANPAFEKQRAAAAKELRTALGLPPLPPKS